MAETDPKPKGSVTDEAIRKVELKLELAEFYKKEGITPEMLEGVDTTDIEDIMRKLPLGFVDRFLQNEEIRKLRPPDDDDLDPIPV